LDSVKKQLADQNYSQTILNQHAIGSILDKLDHNRIKQASVRNLKQLAMRRQGYLELHGCQLITFVLGTQLTPLIAFQNTITDAVTLRHKQIPHNTQNGEDAEKVFTELKSNVQLQKFIPSLEFRIPTQADQTLE
jgi:hypothetical protein